MAEQNTSRDGVWIVEARRWIFGKWHRLESIPDTHDRLPLKLSYNAACGVIDILRKMGVAEYNHRILGPL